MKHKRVIERTDDARKRQRRGRRPSIPAPQVHDDRKRVLVEEFTLADLAEGLLDDSEEGGLLDPEFDEQGAPF